MLCPYCNKEMHLAEEARNLGASKVQAITLFDYGQKKKPWQFFRGGYCPSCQSPIVVHTTYGADGTKQDASNLIIDVFTGIVFPKRRNLPPLPPEVPQDYREDFDESRLVLDLSPKSSAALSRRLLQRILHLQFNVDKGSLQQEISEFIRTLIPPAHLSEQLDAVRVVGNFAAHPLKDTATGAIHDVEPGEAEWLIETLESLFDFAFVQPARLTARKAAINAKLAAAGKPPIK